MAPALGLAWQASLLDSTEPAVDGTFSTLARHDLDGGAWVDHSPGWLRGADALFATLVAAARWEQPDTRMYDRMVTQPRLSAGWRDLDVAVLAAACEVLSARYGVVFDGGGLNLYRDGRDSVAWHRDRNPHEVGDPTVAIVSVGEPRRFLVRPYGGGPSRRFRLGRGDLLVMGGTFQRTWEHTVPKAKTAGPRISITFRHSA